jgi:hypothetical protein
MLKIKLLAIVCIPVSRGDIEPGTGGHPCTGEQLLSKSCSNPRPCTNACAYHCTNSTECRQCCLHFAEWPSSYNACKGYCDDVFPQ